MRLQSLRRKFHRDPSLEERYRATMEDDITKGYARKLSDEEASKSGPRTWYLPHFAVTSSSKPNKVRTVFDAAAEHQGTSLNKNLLQGPDYTNNLVGVLLRFREENVALVGDIENMFHQVKVRPEDQDSLRFLWWREGIDETLQEYAMTVHIFGAADSPCSANSALLRTADDNGGGFDPITIDTLRHNFYVDDLLKSVPTPESAIALMESLIKLWATGGFNLTKFVSNNRKVWTSIPLGKRADPSLDVNRDELPVDRALGVRWHIESETFGFKVLEFEKDNTMRGVLSTTCSVFEPLNLAAPVMLPAKQIMQELLSWIALLRTFPWLLKFLQWIKWSSRKKKEETNTCEVPRRISHEEIEKSKREVVKLVQKSVFPQEIKDLKAGRQVKASSHIMKLKPTIMNDGILRVGGRISRVPVSPDAMNPMILPKNHQVTTILIRYVHEKNGHFGVEKVLPLLREQFWVVRGRAAVREITGRSLEADDFISLLMRFLNRGGHVKELRSDNGSNFVGADREIKEAIDKIDNEKVGRELSQRGCKWVFHPPGASHMSGVWERLVKTVKRSLKAILGKDLIN
ncbi:hypothetical protein AWC38_SpisGene8267 [Stylophora pistillata]|uniref:Uncharacterized protein n=1 Tax=Stylophora pistillata TaxID=50429 RepID=A0A2B4SER9_STYPI|nr:hypothetical protein AWC38_SpisGene8267 [Stylophora pistillata]